MTCETILLKRDPHPWSERSHAPGDHWCYWCEPELYPEMPAFQTCCSRCGDLIGIPDIDPMNESMYVCPDCWKELMPDD